MADPDPSTDPSATGGPAGWDPGWARWLGVVVLALAAALRWEAAGEGVIRDEMALVAPGSVWRVLWTPEAGVNPPLLPFLVNAVAPVAAVVPLGRAVSGVASVAAIAVMMRAVRAAGGTPSSALLVGLVAAAHPALVDQGAVFRVYALTWLVGALHLHALAAGEVAGARWRWTLALLPWLHYLTAPMLALELAALALRGGPWRSGARAALWWFPLAAPILAFADKRGTLAGPWPTLQGVMSLSLAGSPWPVWVVGGLWLLEGPLRWGRLDAARRALWTAAVVPMVVLPAAAMEHTVRGPAWTLALVPWLVWFGVGAAWRGRDLAMIATGALLLAASAERAARQAEWLDDAAVTQDLAAARERWWPDAGVVHVDVPAVAPRLWLAWHGEHLGGVPREERGCDVPLGCFVDGGVQLVETATPPRPGRMVVMDGRTPERCRPSVRGLGWVAFDCDP